MEGQIVFPLYSEPSSGFFGSKGQAGSRILVYWPFCLEHSSLVSHVAPSLLQMCSLVISSEKSSVAVCVYNNIFPTPLRCFCFSHPYFIISPLCFLLTDLLYFNVYYPSRLKYKFMRAGTLIHYSASDTW